MNKQLKRVIAIISFIAFLYLVIYGIVHGHIGYAALSLPFLFLSGLFDDKDKPKKKDIFVL